MNLDKNLYEKANFLVNLSQELKTNPRPEKKGGYLVIALNNFSKMNICPIGTIPKEKTQKYLALAQEKAHRLLADFLRCPDFYVSSWQTRNPETNKWGGSVLFKLDDISCNIFSFSGLAELTDEAISLMLGKHFGGVEEECEYIAAISDNQVYYEMLKKSA